MNTQDPLIQHLVRKTAKRAVTGTAWALLGLFTIAIIPFLLGLLALWVTQSTYEMRAESMFGITGFIWVHGFIAIAIAAVITFLLMSFVETLWRSSLLRYIKEHGEYKDHLHYHLATEDLMSHVQRLHRIKGNPCNSKGGVSPVPVSGGNVSLPEETGVQAH